MKVLFAAALALVMATGGAASVQAQPYDAQDAQGYAQDQNQFEQNNEAYQARESAYESKRDRYDAEHRAYQRRLAAYERARADYDEQYGPGAYERFYPRPYWEAPPPPPDAYYGPR